MNDRWKVARAIGIAATLAWMITFVVTWHIRTGWQQNWLDGAIRAWSNFAMLEWFDTTFATGILAVVAASTVFINGYIDRKARWHEANVVNLANILNTIGKTDLMLRRAAHELATSQREERFEQLIGEAESLCQELASDVRPVAHIVMFAIGRVREIAYGAGSGIDTRPTPYRQMMTLFWGAIYAISDADRLFERGTGRYVPNLKELDIDERANFRAEILKSSDRARFAKWLKWE